MRDSWGGQQTGAGASLGPPGAPCSEPAPRAFSGTLAAASSSAALPSSLHPSHIIYYFLPWETRILGNPFCPTLPQVRPLDGSGEELLAVLHLTPLSRDSRAPCEQESASPFPATHPHLLELALASRVPSINIE